jgi:hypothetical protein
VSGKGSVGFRLHAGDELLRGVAGVLLGVTLGIMFGFVAGFVFGVMFRVQIGFGSFDGFLMFAVGFVFGIFASALGFLVLGVFVIFFIAEMLVDLVSFFFVYLFLFVERGATSQRVSLRTRLCFLMLGFDQAGGKGGELLVIERGRTVASGLRGRRFVRTFLDGSRERLDSLGRS